jgi:hypothetical protein
MSQNNLKSYRKFHNHSVRRSFVSSTLTGKLIRIELFHPQQGIDSVSAARQTTIDFISALSGDMMLKTRSRRQDVLSVPKEEYPSDQPGQKERRHRNGPTNRTLRCHYKTIPIAPATMTIRQHSANLERCLSRHLMNEEELIDPDILKYGAPDI